MGHSIPTIWESMQAKGYDRREFLRFCSFAAMMAGIETAGFSKVVHALETQARPPVVWLHFQECTCCSESFIRSSHPLVADVLLDSISLDYSETLQAAAGHQAEKSLHDTMQKFAGKYILLVEGSIPTHDGGVYCTIGGRTAEDILQEAAKDAAAVIAWGSCASHGCVQSAKPNPTGATPVHKLISKPVINVPGCPPIADVMTGVITHLVVLGSAPELDGLGRPKEFYSRRVHDTCYRRPYYDAGLFVESFDGYLHYQHARHAHNNQGHQQDDAETHAAELLKNGIDNTFPGSRHCLRSSGIDLQVGFSGCCHETLRSC